MSVSDAAVLAAMDTLARHALFLKPEEMRLALEAAEPFLVERERETRENANACTLRVEAERDRLRSAHDSLIGELATILGPGKAPSGVGREEWWIGRVGGALAAVEVERDAARAELRTVEDVLTAAGLEREPTDEDGTWFYRGGGLSPEIDEQGSTAEALVGLVDATRAEAAQAWDAHAKAETAAEAARADVDALLEAIAAVERGNVSHVAWTKANAALYDTANEIAAKRGDAS